jgi:hypothetical protein
MIAKPIALGVLYYCLVLAGCTQHAVGLESEVQKQLSNFVIALAGGSVVRIDFLHMPDQMETRASVGPEELEKWAFSRITISNIDEWAGRDELVEVMKGTSVTKAPRMPDLRSAVILYAHDDKRIGTLYFERFFRTEGAIGSTPVSFRGGLPNWLKHTIPSSLQ